MIINHNITALNTHRQMGAANNAQASSMEKLSSGLRINSAKDDAAGLSISEKMRGQIRGLEQASRNAQDGISMIQTAEGALNETHDMLQRMRELTVQANNGTNNDDDLKGIQKEISELSTEITELASRTEFNTKSLLTGNLGVKGDGTGAELGLIAQEIDLDVSGARSGAEFTISQAAGAVTLTDELGNVQTIAVTDESDVDGTLDFDALGVKFTGKDMDFTDVLVDTLDITTEGNSATLQIGANTNQTLTLQFNDMQATALGTASTKISAVDVTNAAQTFDDRLNAIDEAMKQVSSERSKMGAWQNRMEHTINNLNTSSENLTAAESRIRDVDYAEAA
ncbi:flagellin N-terminal helical domain-containing protein [Metaplanococcus flavidus]|uniref:Flagellin n=1 Tax=Metaplanococcus flavidus TaxID=569883 RepID=A0ABW3LCQ3_9BACL